MRSSFQTLLKSNFRIILRPHIRQALFVLCHRALIAPLQVCTQQENDEVCINLPMNSIPCRQRALRADAEGMAALQYLQKRRMCSRASDDRCPGAGTQALQRSWQERKRRHRSPGTAIQALPPDQLESRDTKKIQIQALQKNPFQGPQGDAISPFMWQDDIINVVGLLTHAYKGCT